MEEQSNRTKIEALAAKLAERAGLELVECDLFHAGRRLILRVFADKEGGISLDDCQKLSRELGTALDLEDLIPQAYTLEVSSPGLDRPLRTTRDFLRNKGRNVRLGLSEPVEGKKALSGRLLGATDELLELELAGGKKAEVKRSAVLQAKVEAAF